MPIELKDITSFTGIEADDMDAFKEAFNEKYLPKEQHTKALGELNGKASHELKKTVKELGLDGDEWKDKNLLESLPLLREKFKGKLAEVEGQKSATHEEVEQKYKADIDKWKQKATDTGQLLESTKTEFEAFRSNVETEKHQFKVDTHFNKAFNGLKFTESANDFTRKGFVSAIREKYAFDIDDDSPVVRGKDGNIIQSKAKAGTPATFEEVLQMELKEAKLEPVVDTKKVPTFGSPSSRISEPREVKRNGFTPAFGR